MSLEMLLILPSVKGTNGTRIRVGKIGVITMCRKAQWPHLATWRSTSEMLWARPLKPSALSMTIRALTEMTDLRRGVDGVPQQNDDLRTTSVPMICNQRDEFESLEV